MRLSKAQVEQIKYALELSIPHIERSIIDAESKLDNEDCGIAYDQLRQAEQTLKTIKSAMILFT